MADHPNAALARQAMDSMNTGDFQAMAAFLDDDVVWHEIGRAEPRRGKAELMEAVGPTSYYDITAEVHDVVETTTTSSRSSTRPPHATARRSSTGRPRSCMSATAR